MLYVILVAFFVFVYLYLFILYYIVIVLILFAIVTFIDFRFICIVRVLSLFVTVYACVWFVSIVARRSAGAELLLGAAALRLLHKLHQKIIFVICGSPRVARTITKVIITMAAGKGGPKRGNPAMRDEDTHAHC